MTLPSHAVTVELSVPFHDCDPMAIVWHGRYFEYLEVSRCELFKRCGLDVPDLVQLGLRMMVTEARCRYTSPLRYADRISVTSWFSEYSPLLKVSYAVKNLTSERRSARAYTTLAVTDSSGELLATPPSSFSERLPS